MNAKPPSRGQSMPASLTKPRRSRPAGPTKAQRADRCVFWAVIIGSLTVALFGV
jgi:hypothetical protein